MPSNKELRALAEVWLQRAKDLDDIGTFNDFATCADELEALLPPVQPPTAYDAVPFATVAEVEDWQKQNT